MRNKYIGIRALALCLGTVVFIGANTSISALATGAGIQLGTELNESVVPDTDSETTETGLAETAPSEGEQEAVDAVDAVKGTDEEVAAQNETENADAVSEQNAQNPDKALTEDEIVADAKLAYVSVNNYSLEGGLLEAGNDLTIVLTLSNISSVASAENVVMTISSDSGMLYPRYGSDNQIFVGTILPGETKKISVPVTVNSRFEGDVTDFSCQFDYTSQGYKMNNLSRMAITTSGGKSLVVKSIDLSANAILNGKSLLNINYSNRTNGNITDAELLIDGNVSDDTKMIKLDTIYAGKSYSKDYSVSFVKAGNQTVSIRLVYTDISGERMQTDLGTFSVTVNEEVASANVNGYSSALLWGGRALAAIMMAIALFVGILYYKKR